MLKEVFRWGICALLFTTLGIGNLVAQDDPYGELERLIFYEVSLSSGSRGGEPYYEADGVPVDLETFEKYQSGWDNMENCCPCILETYDVSGQLLHEGAMCADCGIGWYKEYDQRGNLRIKGQYRTNPTGDMDDIYARGYCSVPDGRWEYFSKRGELEFAEIWDNGDFIRQVPEQEEIEVWGIDVVLDEQLSWDERVPMERLQEVELIPKFKNSARFREMLIRVKFKDLDGNPVSGDFEFIDFAEFDFLEYFETLGVAAFDFSVDLNLIGDGEQIKRFSIKVE